MAVKNRILNKATRRRAREAHKLQVKSTIVSKPAKVKTDITDNIEYKLRQKYFNKLSKLLSLG